MCTASLVLFSGFNRDGYQRTGSLAGRQHDPPPTSQAPAEESVRLRVLRMRRSLHVLWFSCGRASLLFDLPDVLEEGIPHEGRPPRLRRRMAPPATYF